MRFAGAAALHGRGDGETAADVLATLVVFPFPRHGSVESQDYEFDVRKGVDACEHRFGFGRDRLGVQLPCKHVGRVRLDDIFRVHGGVVGDHLKCTIVAAGGCDARLTGRTRKGVFLVGSLMGMIMNYGKGDRRLLYVEVFNSVPTG